MSAQTAGWKDAIEVQWIELRDAGMKLCKEFFTTDKKKRRSLNVTMKLIVVKCILTVHPSRTNTGP